MATKLTRAELDNIFTGYSTKLNEGMAVANTDYLKWCDVVSSTHPIEIYPISQLNSGMVKWVGERIVSKLSAKKTQIENDNYSNTVEVPRIDFLYGRQGMWNSRFTDMGINAKNLWPKLAGRILSQNPTWGDGKAFFCSDRQINDDDSSILLDNLVAGGFSIANFAAAILKGRLMTDSQGDNLELKHDLLIIGPKHERLANKLKNNERIVEDEIEVENDFRGSFDFQVNGAFTGAYEDDFRLLCTTRGAKPVIVQKVMEGELTVIDDIKDSYVFLNDKNLYGIQYVGNAGPGIPQLAIAGIPAST